MRGRKIPISIPITGKDLEYCKAYLLKRAYMSGVERDRARIKATAEVFTPDSIVREMVEEVGMDDICDPEKSIIDPACGDGQFLAYILWCRLESGVSLAESLATLHGVDIMEDNVKLCKERLRCNAKSSKIDKILKSNIVEEDAFVRFAHFVSDDDLFAQVADAA